QTGWRADVVEPSTGEAILPEVVLGAEGHQTFVVSVSIPPGVTGAALLDVLVRSRQNPQLFGSTGDIRLSVGAPPPPPVGAIHLEQVIPWPPAHQALDLVLVPAGQQATLLVYGD